MQGNLPTTSHAVTDIVFVSNDVYFIHSKASTLYDGSSMIPNKNMTNWTLSMPPQRITHATFVASKEIAKTK